MDDKDWKFYKLSTKGQLIRYYPDGVKAGFPAGDDETEDHEAEFREILNMQGKDIGLTVVTGDSMKDAGIQLGDYVYLENSDVAKDGDVVIAQLEDGYTMKYYYYDPEEGVIMLMPANSRYKPIMVYPDQKFRIVGIVVGVHKVIKRNDTLALSKLKKQNDPVKLINLNLDAPLYSFRECIVDKDLTNKVLSALHKLIDGKKGKMVSMITQVAIEENYITTPTYSQMIDEFPNIGARQGFTKYLSFTFNDFEKESMRHILKKLVTSEEPKPNPNGGYFPF